jgi:hypothetical protein
MDDNLKTMGIARGMLDEGLPFAPRDDIRLEIGAFPPL